MHRRKKSLRRSGKRRGASVATSTSASVSALDKLTRNHFDAGSMRLANHSKSIIRERIALLDAFPRDKEVFIWESIQQGAKEPGEGVEASFKRAEQSDDLQDELLEYVRVFAKSDSQSDSWVDIGQLCYYWSPGRAQGQGKEHYSWPLRYTEQII